MKSRGTPFSMCYSPQASFTSAIVLSGMSALTLKKFHTRPEICLALHPLFFAIQQFAEGFIWLDLKGRYFWAPVAKYVFLFFALLVWPVWVGLALGRLEFSAMRKKLMRLTSGIGVMVALGIILFAAIGGGIPVGHATGHLGYAIPFPALWMKGVGKFLYVACILVPFALSTRKSLWGLGTLTVVGFVYANVYPLDNFISIWCFWAAVTSVSIYFFLLRNRQENAET